MTVRLIITVAIFVAPASVVVAQTASPTAERTLPSAIAMTCNVGHRGGEFDVIFDQDEKTLSFVPGERLEAAEHKFAHGLLIISAEQDDVDYSARIGARPFVTIRQNKRLSIFPCSDVQISPEPIPTAEMQSGFRG